jgi:(p)ppGpp synthase/HD superfamily hydrolase
MHSLRSWPKGQKKETHELARNVYGHPYDGGRNDMADQPDVVLGEHFSDALSWVVELQGKEGRKGSGVPYLAHTLSVVSIVLAYGGSEEQATAAALHDVAEDSGGLAALKRIEMDFGLSVANLVEKLSDSLTESKDKKKPWWDRKVAYINKVKSEDVEVALISAADKLDNIRSIRADYRRIGQKIWEIFNKDSGRDGQLWYYGKLTQFLKEILDKNTVVRTDEDGTVMNLPRELGQQLEREFRFLLKDIAKREETTVDALREGIEQAHKIHARN